MRPGPLLAIAALVAPATAAPTPSPTAARAQRKPATLELDAEALAAFVEAVIADKAGDLDEAASRYQSSARRTPHAHTYFNLADVERRLERVKRAIESYRKYLELAPTAPDRRAVERTIHELETMPGTVVIDGESLDAIVFVDGVRVGPSPAVLALPDGRHTTERISPTGYTQSTFVVRTGETHHVSTRESGKDTGNVIVAVSPALGYSSSWTDPNGVKWRAPGRITLAPGRYETPLSHHRTCTPIRFDVPAGDDLLYVYLDVKPAETRDGCMPLAVRTQKVRFAP